ncbi:peptidoglycan-binding protein [Bacillota bacterium Meth-B3]
MSLDYSCGKWGADGEFGKATKSAVIAFQTANNLVADGVVSSKTVAAINTLLPESGEESEAPADPETAKPQVTVTGGSVYLRTLPSASGAIRGVVHKGDLLESAGESVSGWFPVVRDDEVCYISGMYAELAES